METIKISSSQKEMLCQLRIYAEENPLSMDDLLDTMNKEKAPVGNSNSHRVYLDDGIKVVYSIEKQIPGLVRHLSIGKRDDFAPYAIFNYVMRELGFKGSISDSMIYIEDCGKGVKALNVLEIIEDK